MATLATDRHATAHAARFGEPVTLPDGLTVVQGIVSLQGDAIAAPWSEIGLNVRPSQQPNPVVHLRPADASGLIAAAGDASAAQHLSIRGISYRITDLVADESGMIRLALTPETPTVDPDARWQ